MKRTIAAILTLCILAVVVGCAPNSAEETMPTETIIETTTSPASNWEINYYVDEFGDKTDDGYLVGSFEGDFSNTATTKSDLKVYVYIFPSSTGKGYQVAFRLAEYGNHIATYLKKDLRNLTFKIDGEKYGAELFGTAPNGDLYFSDHYAYEDDFLASYNQTDRKIAFDTFFNALKNNTGEISCLITIGNMDSILYSVGGSTYRFKIDGCGFAEKLAELEAKSE